MNRNLTKPSEKMFPSLALQCACKEAAEGISIEADNFPAVGECRYCSKKRPLPVPGPTKVPQP